MPEMPDYPGIDPDSLQVVKLIQEDKMFRASLLSKKVNNDIVLSDRLFYFLLALGIIFAIAACMTLCYGVFYLVRIIK